MHVCAFVCVLVCSCVCVCVLVCWCARYMENKLLTWGKRCMIWICVRKHVVIIFALISYVNTFVFVLKLIHNGTNICVCLLCAVVCSFDFSACRVLTSLHHRHSCSRNFASVRRSRSSASRHSRLVCAHWKQRVKLFWPTILTYRNIYYFLNMYSMYLSKFYTRI